MPDDFLPHFQEARPGTIQAWAPKFVEEYEPRIRASGYWNVVGRLKPGVTIAQARAEMDGVAAQIEAEQPRTNRGSRVEVVTIREHLVGDVRLAVRLFAAAVAVVLLIACVNVTNLLLARGATRMTELAVRSALGASRWRLIGQLFVESLLLATLAAAVALALAAGATRILAAFGPSEVPWVESLHLDWRAAGLRRCAERGGGGAGRRRAGVAAERPRQRRDADQHRRPWSSPAARGAGRLRSGPGADAGVGGGAAAQELRQPRQPRRRVRARRRRRAAGVRVGPQPRTRPAARVLRRRARPHRRAPGCRRRWRGDGDAVHRVEHRHPRHLPDRRRPGAGRGRGAARVVQRRHTGLFPRHGHPRRPRPGPRRPRRTRERPGRGDLGGAGRALLARSRPDRPAHQVQVAGQAARGRDRRRGGVAASRAARRAAAARDLQAVRPDADGLDDAGGAHGHRPAQPAGVGQARSLGGGPAAGVPPHRDARRAGEPHRLGAALRAVRAGRLRRRWP